MLSRRDILKATRKKHAYEKYRWYLGALGIFFAVFIALFIAAGFLSGWKKIVIADITVRGNTIVHTDDIVRETFGELGGAYFFLFHRDNIFLYPKGAVKERLLATFGRIADVKIHRDSLTKLSIAITEYAPAYVWCGESPREESAEHFPECYFADASGYLFAKAPYFSGAVFFELFGPLSGDGDGSIGKRFLDPLLFSKMIFFKDAVEGRGGDAVRLRKTEGANSYALVLRSGTEIIFNSDQDLSSLTGNLDSVWDTLPQNEPIDYIDLRFGNKVFYK